MSQIASRRIGCFFLNIGRAYDHLFMLLIPMVVLCLPLEAHRALADESANERASFSHPIAGLSAEEEAQFSHGAAIFRQQWSAAGAGDPTFAGLGRLSCARRARAAPGAPGRGAGLASDPP